MATKNNKSHFSSKLFRFLKDIAANNDRAWFAENKERYERDVRGPFLAFISDLEKPLTKVSTHLVANPSKVGGSFFRIHRDVRFGKDKSPYKTHAAAHFRHVRAKDVHAPGVYLHVEPGNIFAGAGVWRPESDALKKIRESIADDSKSWVRAIGGKAFKADFELAGDSLKRPPRGFDPEHPQLEALKRKDFIAVTHFKQKELLSADFPKLFIARMKAANGLNKFISSALELPW